MKVLANASNSNCDANSKVEKVLEIPKVVNFLEVPLTNDDRRGSNVSLQRRMSENLVVTTARQSDLEAHNLDTSNNRRILFVLFFMAGICLLGVLFCAIGQLYLKYVEFYYRTIPVDESPLIGQPMYHPVAREVDLE